MISTPLARRRIGHVICSKLRLRVITLWERMRIRVRVGVRSDIIRVRFGVRVTVSDCAT
jgi:hypothetical protein